jgi:hypothetical protein
MTWPTWHEGALSGRTCACHTRRKEATALRVGGLTVTAHWATRVLGILLSATAVLFAASCGGTPGNGPPPVDTQGVGGGGTAVVVTASPIPGDDPAIQHWFLAIDTAKTAFDNALFKAERGISGSSSAACKPLVQTVRTIVGALPRLRSVPSPAGAKIADAVGPLMTTMGQVADLCTSGKFSAAQALLTATGIPQQAEAQALVDEILDGDK